MSIVFDALETHATDMVFPVWNERWHETITPKAKRHLFAFVTIIYADDKVGPSFTLILNSYEMNKY